MTILTSHKRQDGQNFIYLVRAILKRRNALINIQFGQPQVQIFTLDVQNRPKQKKLVVIEENDVN